MGEPQAENIIEDLNKELQENVNEMETNPLETAEVEAEGGEALDLDGEVGNIEQEMEAVE
jgi:hypothetical protein